MAKIELKNVKKSYGAVDVIKGIDLTIEKGEFMVFVGPSGCGKSTLLRLISGLEEISSGDMLFDSERVNNVLPSQRGIAMVFQSYALYPHMTVYDNMAFGMKLAKASPEAMKKRVLEAAKLLQIDHLLERLVMNLRPERIPRTVWVLGGVSLFMDMWSKLVHAVYGLPDHRARPVGAGGRHHRGRRRSHGLHVEGGVGVCLDCWGAQTAGAAGLRPGGARKPVFALAHRASAWWPRASSTGSARACVAPHAMPSSPT